jgi:hypothetical protein
MLSEMKILILILFFSQSLFSQDLTVKILNSKETKYYFIYNTIESLNQDSLIFISSKSDNEFPIFKLEKDKCYKIKYRLRSAIKIEEEIHFLCKPNRTSIEGVQISDTSSLPKLILDYSEVSCELEFAKPSDSPVLNVK